MFEWAKAKKKAFKGKNEGAPHNNIVNVFGESGKGGPAEPAKIEGTTECQQEKVAGETTGPKTTTWKTEYKKCTAIVSKIPTTCNTKDEKGGVIKTDQLSSTLVYLDKAHKKIGIRVKGGGPGGRLAQYECLEGGLNVEVFGEILAEVQGNTNIANKDDERRGR